MDARRLSALSGTYRMWRGRKRAEIAKTACLQRFLHLLAMHREYTYRKGISVTEVTQRVRELGHHRGAPTKAHISPPSEMARHDGGSFRSWSGGWPATTAGSFVPGPGGWPATTAVPSFPRAGPGAQSAMPRTLSRAQRSPSRYASATVPR